jgi:hypothetical protein
MDYYRLRRSLELTDAVTMTPAHRANELVLPDGVRGEVVRTYLDPVSGFQAHRIKLTRRKGPPSYAYVFAATQTTERLPSGEMRSRLDVADLLTNASQGLHQMESAAADQLRADVLADLRAGNQTMMTGQSLGGMMAHSLGYLVNRELREAGQLDLVRKLDVLSWGIPGMGETIRTYIRRNYGRKEQLDPALIQNFEEIAYNIDPLRGIGDHFGKVTTIDKASLFPDEGDQFAMFPNIRVEAHLLPAFLRAIAYRTIPGNTHFVCPGQSFNFRLPRPIQGLVNDITGVLQRMRYRDYLTRHGTAEDWNRCYIAPRWYTNRRRNCTRQEQAGCRVADRTLPRNQRRGMASWCMVQED